MSKVRYWQFVKKSSYILYGNSYAVHTEYAIRRLEENSLSQVLVLFLINPVAKEMILPFLSVIEN